MIKSTTPGQKRVWTLILAGLAVAALVLLAAGLPKLEFFPGKPLPWSRQAEALQAEGTPPPSNSFLEQFYVLLFLFVQLLLPIAIIYFLISSEARRRVLRGLGLLLWIAALLILARARSDLFEPQPIEIVEGGAENSVVTPHVEFTADPPGWLVSVVTLGLALFVAAGVARLGWMIWRRRRESPSSLDQLAQEAQEAIDALQSGADLRNTVMRCYYDMGRVLSQERGLQRETAMTTREFEAYLQKTDLPNHQVRQLTRLFEKVRYGTDVPGEREERQAITCLTGIVEACRT